MNNQPQQRFCTNCGQPLEPGTAFCVACGAQASNPAPGQAGPSSAGAPAGYVPPPYAQAPMQAQEDPLLAGLAAGYFANRMRRRAQRRAWLRSRRPGARLRGCGCLLLILIVVVGLYLGITFTSGRLQMIITYVAAGTAMLLFVMLLLGLFATRGGREAMSEGCLEAIFNGFLGGE